MHQNVCRMNYSNALSMKFQFEKFHFFGRKWPIFSKCKECINMHQNVCRMNCANVLCMKWSKKWFWLHLKGPKLTKYIPHFMVVHPVDVKNVNFGAGCTQSIISASIYNSVIYFFNQRLWGFSKGLNAMIFDHFPGAGLDNSWFL